MRLLLYVALSVIAGLTAAMAAEPAVENETYWIVPHAGPRIDSDPAPRPLQGIRAPDISADGMKIVFSAAGDLWTVDLDPKSLAPGKPPKGKHFTKDAFLEFDPAWSPDGNQLAFVSDRGGKPEIWLHDMKTNKDRQLTELVESVEAPSWSPDGNRIAFYKVPSAGDPAARTLSVVTVFTGDVREVRANVHAAAPPGWSPDGGTVVLKVNLPRASSAPHAWAKFMLVSLTGAPDRFIVPDTGLSPTLKRGDGPVWSPDGTKMAYVDGGTLRALPVAPKGAHVGEVTGPSRVLTTEIADSPRWSGDSKSVLFVAADRLKRIGLDGTLSDVQPTLAWKLNVPAGQTIVWAGRLWDGVGNAYRENVDVVIDGNVISAIEPHRQRDARTRVVNASRKTVIPGLIDSRAHLTASAGERLGRLLLSYGITTVRDWGVDPYDALERRESWGSGRRAGPRELFTQIVADEKSAAAETARGNRLGYDIATGQRPDDAAAQITFGIGEGAKSGAVAVPGLALMGGFVATLAHTPSLVDGGQIDALYSDDEQAALKADIAQATPTLPAIERTVGAAQTALRAYSARGGAVVLGSGAPGVPYGLGFLVECQLAQQSGLSALQVLRAATTAAAAAAGVDKEIGTIEVGKLADLAIIDGDPLKRVSDLDHVAGVVADGHYYIIDELLRH